MQQKAKNIPVYDICALQSSTGNLHDDLIIEPFGAYLERHPHLTVPHRHSFYHILLFTRGKGTHTIDFEQFPVRKGHIYFMIPGQVHSWQFEGETDGYVLNCSEHFLTSFLKNERYTDQFPFLDGIAGNAVLQLQGDVLDGVKDLMKNIQQEAISKQPFAMDMIKMHLLQLFITVSRNEGGQYTVQAQQHNAVTLRNFRKLVEQHFATLKLPKDYAAMLYITPNHLNALCKDQVGKQAGELIRDRILLEAKRLLVNMDMQIASIAYELNFTDNSYFTKFFKKLTGITPEQFRKTIMDHNIKS
jgi:AraC family transcriptional activator of pobA